MISSVRIYCKPTYFNRRVERHFSSKMTRKSRDFVFRWNSPASLASRLTGSSRLDPGFYGVRVVHICVFLSSCVSLPIVCPSTISCFRCSGPFFGEYKRFGFWPHITHVIMLTFKEIKHVSDYRTVGPSDCRTIGPSDYRTVGL